MPYSPAPAEQWNYDGDGGVVLKDVKPELEAPAQQQQVLRGELQG